MKFIDLFAGIGGIRLGFEKNGFKAVFSNDFDPYCKITYSHNFDCSPDFSKDIIHVSSGILPEFNLLTGGFPCQPFSIAGHRKGFTDEKNGNLFFEIVRILKDKKPEIFLLENVKNLKSHDKGKTLRIIYKELKNIGYYVKDAVLNTTEYGNLPQNRERIYIVGFLSKNEFDRFRFPEKIKLTKTVYDCLIKEKVADKYYYNNKPLFSKLKNRIVKRDTVYQWRRKYVRENKSSVCPALTANMGTGGQKVPIILDDYGIRRLTPRECASFQGFPVNYILPEISDYQLYKQIGNSVSVPVIERIAKQIKKAVRS